MNIVHIVPSLDPSEAVGNYAILLAKALHVQTQIPNRMVLARSSDTNCGFPVMVLSPHTPEAVAAALTDECDSNGVVIAHLSHYGFATRGTPFWLLRGVERWISLRPPGRLIVVFHELYALGPPWSSSFWLSPLQKWITRRFLEICDFAVTTTERYETALLNWRPNAALRRLPVFSLVGEPAFVLPAADRASVAVVFGSTGVEDRLYGRMASTLVEIITKLNIERIIDIGPRLRAVPAMIGQVPVEVLGALPADCISKILQDARYGLIAYPSDMLEKSTIFAAYAAHGVIPLLLWPNTRVPDKEALFLCNEAIRSLSPGESLILQARLTAWYRAHSTAHQIKAWEDLIREVQVRCVS